MTETEQEIRTQNRRMAWGDVANHLKVAAECLDHALAEMEELDVQHLSGNLEPIAAAVVRFQVLAEEKSSE